MSGSRIKAMLTVAFFMSLVSAFSVEAEAQAVAAPEAVYTVDELQNLVGPIALYPDDVLAVLLPAATYPLQIVEAQRFLDGNPQEGEAPASDWDPTVIAMLNYPEALALLSEDLEWTATLGDAVLAQENDVLEAIEQFRDAAWLAGNLESNERQRVVRSAESIEILPAEPDVVYLPYYDPATVIIRQPRPVVSFFDWGYPLYYHAYPSAFVFDRLFFRVPTFYEISWRNRYLHLFGFDYGFWWNRRAGFYAHAPLNAFRYNRFGRHFGGPVIGFQPRRWQHRARAGVRSSRYQRYGRRDRGARARQGYRVQNHTQGSRYSRANRGTRDRVANNRQGLRSGQLGRRADGATRGNGSSRFTTRNSQRQDRTNGRAQARERRIQGRTDARSDRRTTRRDASTSPSRFSAADQQQRTRQDSRNARSTSRQDARNSRSAARSESRFARRGTADTTQRSSQQAQRSTRQAQRSTAQPRREVTTSRSTARSQARSSRSTARSEARSSRSNARAQSRSSRQASRSSARSSRSSARSSSRSSSRGGGGRSRGSSSRRNRN
ncbi:MAG: DUF3300 domain-containing protein [Pseudomonadota bacterium]